jgi:formylglycine-generating enzyme required for sulfatase activity
MPSRGSSSIVLVVAAVTGVALAQVAVAGGAAGGAASGAPGSAPSAPSPNAGAGVTGLAALAASVATPAGSASREESEGDEPRAAPGDNPYEEGQGKPAAIVRQAVVARDGMLRLPGGRFTMGSSNQRAPANERPTRAATVATFWIDRTEVTVGAYRACVTAGSCGRPERASAACTFDAGDPDLPISCVHWRDADAYCRFVGKRLPTEREWEYAARGTAATPFPWGPGSSCTNAVTLVNDQSGRSCAPRPARVGTHPAGASLFGVHDLSGNVEEWTGDWYVESLSAGPAPRAGAAHVLRGGGWLSPPSQSRTTSRDWGSALEAGPNVGLRCARDD